MTLLRIGLASPFSEPTKLRYLSVCQTRVANTSQRIPRRILASEFPNGSSWPALAPWRAGLVLAFAVLSLMLASVGLYGVLSYLTMQRTGEIGVRMALGAQRRQVLRMMLGDGLRPALYGLVLGLAASAGAVRLIQSMLYGTRPLDPAIFAAVAATLLLVAALACLIPACRASQIDPMQALRTE